MASLGGVAVVASVAAFAGLFSSGTAAAGGAAAAGAGVTAGGAAGAFSLNDVGMMISAENIHNVRSLDI